MAGLSENEPCLVTLTDDFEVILKFLQQCEEENVPVFNFERSSNDYDVQIQNAQNEEEHVSAFVLSNRYFLGSTKLFIASFIFTE